ncbi:MAG TPA: hypothetical protein VGN21_04075 [Stellaceae bacterium]|jgi:hypothetical protein
MDALIAPFELADAELDLVTGGLALAAGGLVNLSLNTGNIDVLRNAFQNATILSGFTIQDVASHNNLNVGAIIQALGGGAAIQQRQLV